MKPFKYRIIMSTCFRLSFLFTFLVSPVSLFAFSDLNDSTSQDDIVKSLQKRLDSLELRFEKSEIEKNEAKKSVFDWNRGFFYNISLNASNLASLSGTTASGYMFSKTKKDNARVLLCPQLRFGTYYYSSEIVEKHDRGPMDILLSAGLEKRKRVGDRVSYCDGWFVNIVPAHGQISSSLSMIGGEYSNSLHFFYNENTSIGIGAYYRLSSILDDNTSWKHEIKNGNINIEFSAGLRLIITSFFARHEPRSRSK